MKFLFDFFPVLLFFVAYYVQGIYVATAVAMAATCVQVAVFWVKHRRFEKLHLVTLGLILVFGGMTLYLQNPLYIKWKTTLVEWAFALAFLGSQFIGRRTLVERLLGKALAAPAFIWSRLNVAWVLFFVAMGFLNLYVMYNFDEATWVNFKLFGMMGLTFAFVLAQGFFLARYMKDQPENENPSEGEG